MKFKILLHIIFVFSSVFAQDHPFINDKEIPEHLSQNSADFHSTHEILKDPYVLFDTLNLRNFENDFQSNYASHDFDYHRSLPRKSLWQKVMDKLDHILSKIFRNADIQGINKYSFWLIRIFAIGILGLVGYWLIKFLMNKEGSWFFNKKSKAQNPELRAISENIHEIDFNHLISQYENQNDYRYAVRYQFLKTLKLFNDKKYLTWDPDKTNLDYIHELKNFPRKKEFARLTLIFDHVWYGDFQINAELYAKYKTEFNDLIKHHE